ANILAQDHDPRIPLQHDVHRGVEGLDHVHVSHGINPLSPRTEPARPAAALAKSLSSAGLPVVPAALRAAAPGEAASACKHPRTLWPDRESDPPTECRTSLPPSNTR